MCFSRTTRWLAIPQKNVTPVTRCHMLWLCLSASQPRKGGEGSPGPTPSWQAGKAKRRSKPVQILPASCLHNPQAIQQHLLAEFTQQTKGQDLPSLHIIAPCAFNKRCQSCCMMPTHGNSDELCSQMCCNFPSKAAGVQLSKPNPSKSLAGSHLDRQQSYRR